MGEAPRSELKAQQAPGAPRLWPRLAAAGLGTLLLCGVVAVGWLLTADRGAGAVLADARPLATTGGPFSYESDTRRFARLVLQPLCRSTEREIAETWGPAVSRRCTLDPQARFIAVELKPGLTAGKDKRPVAPADLARGLAPVLDPYCLEAVAVADQVLRIQPVAADNDAAPCTTPVPLELLYDALDTTLAVVVPSKDTAVGPPPLGTGPFYVSELWCADPGAKDAPTGCQGNAPPPRPLGALDPFLADQVVLRRRGRRLTGLNELVVAGLLVKEEERAEKGERAEKLAAALGQTLAAGGLHAVLGIESDLEPVLRDEVPAESAAWSLVDRKTSSVLVAAVNPSEQRLTRRCRNALACALNEARADPAMLRLLQLRPAVQLLPEPFDPVHVWRPPRPIESSWLPDEVCRIEIVANPGWKTVAQLLVDRFNVFVQGNTSIAAAHTILPPSAESARRKTGAYDLSLLGLLPVEVGPASFLWDNLEGTHWASPEHLAHAKALALEEHRLADLDVAERHQRQEALDEALDELHGELDAYLVPLGSPRSYAAIHDRLLGVGPDTRVLDPDRISLVASSRPWLVIAWALVLGGMAMLVAYSRWTTDRAEQRRRFEETRRAEAEDREAVLERALRVFRHELLSPLSTIKAYGESLEGHSNKVALAVQSEADSALDVVDRARFVLREGAVAADEGLTLDLAGEVVTPVIASQQLRVSYESNGRLEIQLTLEHHPPLRIGRVACALVVKNLVQNAWKHRSAALAQVKLIGKVQGDSYELTVEDDGPGVPDDEVARIFERGRQGRRFDGRRVQGMGLGLYLAREVAEANGGSLDLVSPCQPTLFVVTFPLAGGPMMPEEQATAHVSDTLDGTRS